MRDRAGRPTAVSSDDAPRRPLVLAHRGDHRRCIENTADALLDACRLPGVDGVEFDVRSAADGEPVIVHDDTLERAFGVPLVVGEEAAATFADTAVGAISDAAMVVAPEAAPELEVGEMALRGGLDAGKAAATAGADGSSLVSKGLKLADKANDYYNDANDAINVVSGNNNNNSDGSQQV